MTRDMMTCVPCARAKCREYTSRRRAEREARGEQVRVHLLPLPADFAARAGGITDKALGELYGVSVHVVRRWRRELGIAPARGSLPKEFARLAAGMTGPQVAKRWGVTDKVAYRWLRIANGPRAAKGRPGRTAPADLAERALAHTMTELLAHYGVGIGVLRRWLKQVGVSAKPAGRGCAPADFAAICATRHLRAIERHYGVSTYVVERWLRESGIKLREGRGQRLSFRAMAAPPPPELPSSRPAQPVHVHTNGCRDCTPQRLCRAHQTAQLNADIEAWLAAGNAPREVPQGATGLQLGWGRPVQ